MPIRTTFAIRPPSRRASRAAHSSCSKISPPVRLRPRPIAPVAQNVQARAQPDCDETQTARRSPCRISTVSIGNPSRVRNRAFTVWSAERCCSSRISSANGSSLVRRARTAFDSVVTSSQEAARSRVTPWRTCSLRYDGSPQSASSDIAVSSCTKARVSMILDPVVARYLDALYPASDPVLAEMEAQGAADGVPIVMRDGGLMLGVLARAAGARRVIECGTAIGVSTLHLARAVGEGGYVVSFDVDPDRQATARAYLERAGVADRVDLRLQPALDGLADLDGTFDLAFLDAIKSEYAAYVELALPLLRT